MFIGEMGCWLVLGLSMLYKTFIAPRLSRDASPLLAGGYRPVNEDDGDDDDHTIHGPQRHPKPIHEDDDRIPLRGWRIFLLAAPACCDIAGTTLMNVGLLFVAASIYQMTRGALVLFVGLFSVLFLRRKLYLYQWSALFVVVTGVAIVGLAGALYSGESGHDLTQDDDISGETVANTPQAVQTIIGVLLIAAAQIFTATQFVLEEWILENYAMDPIQVVGWEGIFGFSVTVIGMIVMYFAVGSTEAGRYGYFDIKEGWHEIISNRAVATSSVMIMISIGYASSLLKVLSRILTYTNQGLQLLWSLRYPLRLCHLAQHNRHLPHTFHLGRLSRSWLGILQVATSSRLRSSRLWNLPFQRHCPTPSQGLSPKQCQRGSGPAPGGPD